MLNRLRTISNIQNWQLDRRKTLLAVSGGADSMAMLALFLEAGYPMEVAHCNFGLRHQESDLDQKLVEDYCSAANLHLHVMKFDTAEFARENKLSIQQAARRLRYTFFAELSVERKLDFIATAHHGDDNLENFFIYLLRNNTAAAFRGIPVENGNIIRPLIGFEKKELRDYLARQKVPWREDASNSENKYLRNKVRNMLLPGILEFYPEARQDLEQISSAMTALEKQTGATAVFRLLNNEEWMLPFEACKHPLVKQIFRTRLKNLCFHESRILQVMASKVPGKNFSSEKGVLFITRLGYEFVKHKAQEETIEIHLSNLPLEIEAGNFRINLDTLENREIQLNEEGVWYFSMEDVLFPLFLRPWKHGDRMSPFGMQGKKKVSDILVDKKVESAHKMDFPVLESGTQILGLPGLCRSNLAVVQSSSGTLLKVAFSVVSKKR